MRFLFLLGLLSTSFFGLSPVLPALRSVCIQGKKAYLTPSDRVFLHFDKPFGYMVYLQSCDSDEAIKAHIKTIRFDANGPYFLKHDLFKCKNCPRSSSGQSN